MNQPVKPAKRAKPAFDLGASMQALVAVSATAADNRFEVARKVVQSQPSAVTAPAVPTSPDAVESPAYRKTVEGVDVSTFVVGQSYVVPIDLVDSNPFGARVFYPVEDTDDTGRSIKTDGQKVAANAFVKGHRIELIDGETRLRGARAFGVATLEVKIEVPPSSAAEQYRRSALLNSHRTNHSSLDTAVRLKDLWESGAYETQDELGKAFPDEKGKPLSKSQVNMLLRIGGMPQRFLQKMSQASNTSGLMIAYEISGMFSSAEYQTDPDKFDLVVSEAIAEIQAKQLGKSQSVALIASKLQGKKSRLRAERIAVKYGPVQGTLQWVAKRGQVSLSFEALPEAKLEELKDLIRKMLDGQLSI
jgi:ParB family transcriptional regulator, chromosome partitioning protein